MYTIGLLRSNVGTPYTDNYTPLVCCMLLLCPLLLPVNGYTATFSPPIAGLKLSIFLRLLYATDCASGVRTAELVIRLLPIIPEYNYIRSFLLATHYNYGNINMHDDAQCMYRSLTDYYTVVVHAHAVVHPYLDRLYSALE